MTREVKSRIIQIVVRDDGTIDAKATQITLGRASPSQEIGSANLRLHNKPWQLDDLMRAVRAEIDSGYNEMIGVAPATKVAPLAAVIESNVVPIKEMPYNQEKDEDYGDYGGKTWREDGMGGTYALGNVIISIAITVIIAAFLWWWFTR